MSSDYSGKAQAVVGEQISEDTWYYDIEKATYSGEVYKKTLQDKGQEFSYLEGFSDDHSYVEFPISVEEQGMYHLNFLSHGIGGEKINLVLVDEEIVAEVTAKENSFGDSRVFYVYLEAGNHTITLEKMWGHIAIKGLELMKTKVISEQTYEVEAKLVNPNASMDAKQLMQYLTDQYGKSIISGQTANGGHLAPEFLAISRETGGKVPAILGLDFIEESASRKSREKGPDVIGHAKAFHELGGIITFMWHWNAPEKYLYNTNEHPWWSGFYTEHTTIDLASIMDGADPEGYDLLIKELDEIAQLLKELQKEGIPILWRPLHEASGGWFWWGDSGPEPFVELWQLMYDRFVNIHELDNLIWVWNGQDKEWYPGDGYVDIIGEDIYPEKQVYSSQAHRFTQALNYTDQKKMVVLSENGCLPDPDLLERDNVFWGYFTSWDREFIVDGIGRYSEEYTDKEMLKKVYNHERVITLDELPNLREYPVKE